VFREFAALTGFENHGARVLDLGPLQHLNDHDYATLDPVRWPVRADGGTDRPFAAARYATPNGKARFEIAQSSARPRRQDFPLILNTGRVRDQWHTMTRTGLSPRLMRHAPEPYVEIHPRDAAAHEIADGALARVRSEHGQAVLTARVLESVRPGEIFAPMHWTDAFAPQARANALVNARVDARSGQPEFKYTPAAIEPAPVAWRAFLLTRQRSDPPASLWWRRIPQSTGALYEIAAPPGAMDPSALATAMFSDLRDADMLSARDSAGAFLRMAALRGDRLERALFATTTRGLPARDWLIAQLDKDALDDESRRLLLAGGTCGAPRGTSVCACFDVSRTEIEALAATESGVTVARVGAALKAGSNCGSCRPEIAQILAQSAKEDAHAAA
jgi:assimilatory nitrate reductase catalytic subunit